MLLAKSGKLGFEGNDGIGGGDVRKADASHDAVRTGDVEEGAVGGAAFWSAALVAVAVLARDKKPVDEPLGEVTALAREPLSCLVQEPGAGEQVPLHAQAVAPANLYAQVAGVGLGFGTGRVRDPTSRVHDAPLHLGRLGEGRSVGDEREHLLRALTERQELEPPGERSIVELRLSVERAPAGHGSVDADHLVRNTGSTGSADLARLDVDGGERVGGSCRG